MSAQDNLFEIVTTYQETFMAKLLNSFCALDTFEKKFEHFENFKGNLGTEVSFETPPRSYTARTLTPAAGPSQQYRHTLVVDQPYSTFRSVTAQELIYNDMESYMKKFGDADVAEMGSTMEIDVLLNAISGLPVRDTKGIPTGALHTESGPYICYGDGRTPINSYQQIAQFIADFRYLGNAGKLKFYIPSDIEPKIIGTGANQFVPQRNDRDAMSWVIGDWNGVTFYRSNLLPKHTAGTLGQDGATLTVVSTNDSTGANITQITFSGAGTDSSAIKAGDIITFDATNNIGFVTEYGHAPTQQKVQFRARNNAASSGGNVVVDVAYLSNNSLGLISQTGTNQNISGNILPGMTATVATSHIAGFMMFEDCGFLAMPQMPSSSPWTGSNAIDKDSGASIRVYHGMLPYQNEYGYVHDGLTGSTMVPRRCARIAFPTTL